MIRSQRLRTTFENRLLQQIKVWEQELTRYSQYIEGEQRLSDSDRAEHIQELRDNLAAVKDSLKELRDNFSLPAGTEGIGDREALIRSQGQPGFERIYITLSSS